MAPQLPPKLALVLSGGGARGAYEAGIIHYIRTMLPEAARTRRFDIQCGSSVGAINTCFMVSTAHDHNLQARDIKRLWENLRSENIYKRNMGAMTSFLRKSSTGMLMKLFKSSGKSNPHFPGFLDTAPFTPFIREAMDWKQLTRNIRDGLIDALSLVATNVLTGRLELFIQKHEETAYHGDCIAHLTKITPDHARASAAIPIMFPAVMIDDVPYIDGGLRLNTPLSPAIHLGADRVLAVGLSHRAQPGEDVPQRGQKGRQPALGAVVSRVMNAIFLDRVQYDFEQLNRINRIIEWGQEVHGESFLEEINTMIQQKNFSGDIADRGLKHIKVLRIRPSEDIGEIFRRCFRKRDKDELTFFEKFLLRMMDVDPYSGVDLLSYISFSPEYLKQLLALGFEDARSQHEEIKAFMTD